MSGNIRQFAVGLGAALMACLGAPGGAHAQTIISVTQVNYDKLGRVQCTAVRMDRTQWSGQTDACEPQLNGPNGADRITKNVYDAAGQLVQVRKAFGTPLEQAYVTYGYTPNGKQEYVVDANGNKARLIYDGFDRQTQWQFPSASAPPSGFDPSTPEDALTTSGEANPYDREEYGYDANGNRNRLTKRDGAVLEYQYDALNRLTHKRVPNPTGGAATTATANCHAGTALAIASDSNDVCYDYDLRGLRTSARFGWEAGSGVGDAFDALGRLTSSTTNMGGASRTISYQYDASGNRTRVTHPDDNYFTYDYDGRDRLLRIRENGGTAFVSTTWNAQGLKGTETRGGVLTRYGYDAMSRLKSIEDDLAGTSFDVITSFGVGATSGYNPANQIVSVSRSNGVYHVDSRKNVDRTYKINGLNQYSEANSVGYDPMGYGYDANGNLITEADRHYAYDAENRLLSSSNGANLVYDPLGRLFETGFGSGGVTRFVYDGDQLTLEYDASGNLLRRYVHGTGDDDPLLWYEGAGLTDRRSLQTDHQGSVVSVADAGGNAIEINSYDEYGVGARSNIGRFQYTGQAWIPELGMFYYKARIYSPSLGRFLQTDPIGYEDQVNLYAYVQNDPINNRDPDGKQVVQGAQVVGRACAANTTCTNLAARGAMVLAAAVGIKAKTEISRPRVNIDTNVLINVLDRPGSPAAANAAAALKGRVATISPHAAAEYIAGSEKAGISAATAQARFAAFVASGAATFIGPGDPLTAGKLMLVNGLSYNDAQIVAAGMDNGLKTLTADVKTMARKIPEYTETYLP